MKNLVISEILKNTIYCVYDNNANIIDCSESFASMMKYKKKELVGKNQSFCCSEQSIEEVEQIAESWIVIRRGELWKGIQIYRTRDNSLLYLNTIITPLFSEDKAKKDIQRYLLISNDVTNSMYEKTHCLLTDLKNKTSLKKDLSSCNDKKKVFFAIVDIDDFSSINSIYGGEYGNHVLKVVSQKLSLIGKFTLYRIKDDEFGLLYNADEVAEQDVKLILNRLINSIKKLFATDIRIIDKNINVRVTLGASYTLPYNALEYTNLAYKEAKRLHYTGCLYTKKLDLTEDKVNNMKMTSLLRSALSDDRVIVFYQPIVCCSSKSAYKYEALVRIKDEEGKIISPDKFLNLSQRTGMYSQITKVVLKRVFNKLEEDRSISLSLNISMEDIIDVTTRALIFKLLLEKGTQVSSRVTFEIVETIDICNYELFNKFSRYVRGFNAKIAIDDFGAGYSNFAHLTKITFDYVKIDGQFVKGIGCPKNKTVIESIMVFCKKHKIKTIAEYVENKNIYEELCKLGVDYSQGYYFGKPAINPEVLFLDKEFHKHVS